MSRIIAVHGATGMQGGSVVKSLLKSDWKVRAITRNASGAAAKSLSEAGIQVVTADFDDEASLIKAYEDVEAIFLVTNFWEHLLSGKSAVQAGEAEAAQALTVAKIADKLPHLKRFIWSTLPGNAEGQTKRTVVQHFDFKAQVDVKIKNQYPQLAAKTTFLYVGYYATNLSEMPFAKFFTIPMSFGTYLWMSPVPRDTIFPSAGDTSVNVGVFVKAILAQPEKTLGKYATLVADTPTQADIVDLWSAATGKRAAYLQVNAEDWGKAFGEVGDELYANLKCFYDNPRWAFDNNALTGKDLGIEKELVGTKECLEKYKERLL